MVFICCVAISTQPLLSHVPQRHNSTKKHIVTIDELTVYSSVSSNPLRRKRSIVALSVFVFVCVCVCCAHGQESLIKLPVQFGSCEVPNLVEVTW